MQASRGRIIVYAHALASSLRVSAKMNALVSVWIRDFLLVLVNIGVSEYVRLHFKKNMSTCVLYLRLQLV